MTESEEGTTVDYRLEERRGKGQGGGISLGCTVWVGKEPGDRVHRGIQ